MNNALSSTADTSARHEALDTSQSFCVQAPAGSGKTELLTQRMLKLLSQCEKPEQVLAITFTRKAAGEMRSRVINSIEEAQAHAKNPDAELPPHKLLTLELATRLLEKDQACGWQLLQNPQRLNIRTIDGFNHMLAAAMPLSSGFGSQPVVTEDIDILLEEAVQDCIDTLGKNSDSVVLLTRLLEHFDNKLANVQALLVQMLRVRDQWLESVMAHRADPDTTRQILSYNLKYCIQEKLEQAFG